MNNASSQPRWRSWIDTASGIAVMVGACALVWKLFMAPAPVASAAPQKAPPTEPMSLGDSWVKGSRSASVAVIAYSDFECPFCGAFARDVMPALEEKYVSGGSVVFAFRHFPLASHRLALKAAQASECAGRDGKFWQMHDSLFLDQSRLEVPSLLERADRLQLQRAPFEKCLSEKASERMAAERKEAASLGVTGTPTFFVGRVQADGRVKVTDRLSGARPGLLDEALDRLLHK